LPPTTLTLPSPSFSCSPLDFIPQKFASLREVPLYAPGVRERFERCLDLYLAPRAVRDKLRVDDPDALLPKLPDPAELRPFPTTCAVVMTGHEGRVRTLSLDPSGVYAATGSDDKTVRLWHLATGRCLRTWAVPGVPTCVAWNPNPACAIVAVLVEDKVLFLCPGTVTPATAEATFAALSGARREGDDAATATTGPVRRVVDVDTGKEVSDAGVGAAGAGAGGDGLVDSDTDEDADGEEAAAGAAGGKDAGRAGGRGHATTVWTLAPEFPAEADGLIVRRARDGSSSGMTGLALTLTLPHHPKRLAWHGKGDYLVTASATAATAAVMVHQLSKHASIAPVKTVRGQIQTAAFHPRQPWLYVASQQSIRVYDLTTQTQVRKLAAGVRWVSSMELHPTGDHVLVGGFDHRTVWLDTELSDKPFKTLRYHAKTVRRVTFHPALPLMATASDDGAVHIFHARVFNDFTNNPLLVPVKILKGHAVTADGYGVLDAAYHPTEPWLITAGADGTLRLWHNLP